jgi:hypothetical protein
MTHLHMKNCNLISLSFKNLLIQFFPNPLLHGTPPMGFLPLSNVLILDPPIPNTPPLLTYECPPPFLTPLVWYTFDLIFSSSTFRRWGKKYIKPQQPYSPPCPPPKPRCPNPIKKHVMITQFFAIIFGPTTYQ